jgi:hypothetical protein
VADENSASESSVPSSDSSPASYQRLLPRIMAVTDQRPITVDVMYVVTLVLGCVARIEQLRAELLKMPDFQASLLDDLDDMARALQHAHGLYLQATKSPQALQNLLDRATVLRDLLHAEAIVQAKRGVVNPDSFREVKKNNGHRALVVDLQILVATLREKLSTLTGKSSVTGEELDSAVLLIDTLTQAIGTKEHTPAMREETIEIRTKAFALLVSAYEEVRSAVVYVRRRAADADNFAPSLYANRTARTTPTPSEDTGSTGVHPVATPAPANTSASADLSATLTQNGPFKRASEG